jgi:phage terminase large subunit-like protein
VTPADLGRWRRRPAAFLTEVLRDPDTGQPFALTQAQRRFLRVAFLRAPDGRLRFPELLFAAPKKSGKTAFAAMLCLYVTLILGGWRAEAYCCANDLDQAQGRVFAAIKAILAASPLLAREAEVTATRISFPVTGATIQALASDFAGAAGANPVISVFDELWAYMSERSQRLWDEMVPPPTRRLACRLTVTYAGFSGESDLLEGLYKRALAGRRIGPDLHVAGGLLAFWTHAFTAPWQSEAWREQMREQLRPNAYLRLIENRWVTSEEAFVPLAWWDACSDPALRPALEDRALEVWVGLDASVKRDSTALVAVAWDADRRLRLVAHRIFQPSVREPLDFEATVEATLREWRQRFRLRLVRYDPYQLQAVAQRLAREGLPMQEWPQSVPNLTASGTALYEAVKGQTLRVYPDAAVRLAVGRAVALATSRGWRLAKEQASHRIDVVVALALAVHAALEAGPRVPIDFARHVIVGPPLATTRLFAGLPGGDWRDAFPG